jgi:Lrp/AsnC family transcriptional regulator
VAELAEAARLPRGHLLQTPGAAAGHRRAQRAVTTQIHWPALGYTVEVSLRITLDKTDPRAFDEFLAAARGCPR